MFPVFIRPAQSGEGEQFFKWSQGQEGFDPEIAYHPGTFTLVAYDKQGKIAFLPVQQPYMIETLAPNPDTNPAKVAVALKEFIQFLVTQCHIKKIPEIYFLGSHEITSAFACNHVFQEMPYKVFRLKISDLEKPETEQETNDSDIPVQS